MLRELSKQVLAMCAEKQQLELFSSDPARLCESVQWAQSLKRQKELPKGRSWPRITS